MKVYIEIDEQYPAFSIETTIPRYAIPEQIIDIDEKTYKRWQRIIKAWDKMHDEIKELIGL